jgi:hypothetical protein
MSNRYCTEVIVYNDNPDEDFGGHAERVFAVNVTADSELAECSTPIRWTTAAR